MPGLRGRQFFCSWSGGKDSCLSLYRAVKADGVPAALITMMTEGGERSRSHGLRLDVIRAQAEALSVSLVTRSASWGTYEDVFREAVREFAVQRITIGAFGDIDLDEHREWCVRVCAEAGAEAVHPLWKMDNLMLSKALWAESSQLCLTPSLQSGYGSAGSCP